MGKRKAAAKGAVSKRAKKESSSKSAAESEAVVKSEVAGDDEEGNGAMIPGLAPDSNDASGAGGGGEVNGGANAAAKAAVKGKSKGDEMKMWRKMVDDLGKTSNVKKGREIFEKLLERFPLADEFWVQYCQLEFKALNFDQVDALLKRSLLRLNSVRLWLFYLAYIQERKLGKGSKAAQNPELEMKERNEIDQAFKFALDKVGSVFESGQIWAEYIKFIESARVDSQVDLSNRAAAARTARQLAVKEPVDNMEGIWSGLEEKYKSQDVQTEYMKARAIYLDRKPLYKNVGDAYGKLPEPFVAGNTEQIKALANWKALLTYEREDPERLTSIKPAKLKTRMRALYQRALSQLYFYPEIWFEYSEYELESGDPESALAILEDALHAMPDSLVLHFALADQLEARGRAQRARDVYARLERKNPSPLVFIQSQHFERRAEGVSAARAVFRRARASPVCDSSVFTAAALLEWRCNKDVGVARNIFELGLKRFPKDGSFIMGYIHFLEALNNDEELVTLFERVLHGSLDPKDAIPIWQRYREVLARFSLHGGTLKRLERVEKEFLQAFPDRATVFGGLGGKIHRYAYLGNYSEANPDERYFERCKHLSLGPHARLLNGVAVADGGNMVGLGTDQLAISGAMPGVAVDTSAMPDAVKKLDQLLPRTVTMMGSNFPVSTDYIISNFVNFELPPKSVFTSKKIADKGNDDGEETDLFSKRRRAKR